MLERDCHVIGPRWLVAGQLWSAAADGPRLTAFTHAIADGRLADQLLELNIAMGKYSHYFINLLLEQASLVCFSN